MSYPSRLSWLSYIYIYICIYIYAHIFCMCFIHIVFKRIYDVTSCKVTAFSNWNVVDIWTIAEISATFSCQTGIFLGTCILSMATRAASRWSCCRSSAVMVPFLNPTTHGIESDWGQCKTWNWSVLQYYVYSVHMFCEINWYVIFKHIQYSQISSYLLTVNTQLPRNRTGSLQESYMVPKVTE